MNRLLFQERELDVMSILWRAGSGTVAEVRDALGEELAYTSVLSALQALQAKGYVRYEVEGRAHRYFPLVGAQEAGENALARIRDRIFHGSAELLLAHLVSDHGVSREELERMQRLLQERLRGVK